MNTMLTSFLPKWRNSNYASSFNDFWTTPACLGSTKNDTPVPILFNTANHVFIAQDFPEQVHDYLIEKNKSPEVWLKAINTPTSDGYTFLDYLNWNFLHEKYGTENTKKAALNIISYLCKNGGVYGKYKDTMKCQ